MERILHLALEFLSLTIPTLVLMACISLYMRFGGIPVVLLLIGSTALLMERIIAVGIILLMPYVVTHPNTAFVRAVWPTCTPNPAFYDAMAVLSGVGWPCLFLGFLWFSLRIARRT